MMGIFENVLDRENCWFIRQARTSGVERAGTSGEKPPSIERHVTTRVASKVVSCRTRSLETSKTSPTQDGAFRFTPSRHLDKTRRIPSLTRNGSSRYETLTTFGSGPRVQMTFPPKKADVLTDQPRYHVGTSHCEATDCTTP